MTEIHITEKNTRSYGIDLLRIIAMLGIILLHIGRTDIWGGEIREAIHIG